MPLYEFYCEPCNTIFTFYSKKVNVTKKPVCPRCSSELERRISMFSFSQKMRGTEALPFKTHQAEEGVKKVKQELDRLKAKDPQEAAQFKQKFERWSGVTLDYDIGTPVRKADDDTESEPESRGPEEEPGAPFRDETIYEL